MHPAKEAALRKLVAQHGGPLNGYLLPFLNMIADGVLTLAPEIGPPALPTLTK
jgi:hypothetical protein